MISFNKIYFLLTILLFFTEVIIALYVRDSFIRPYGGDYLVVILIYSGIKSISDKPANATALRVLLFSYLVETLQYFRFIYLLGWEKSTIVKILIGSSFAWLDLVMYTLGILTVILIEKNRTKTNTLRSNAILCN